MTVLSFLGNIVTDTPLGVKLSGNYHVTDTLSDAIEGVPTLIIGKSKAESVIDNFDINRKAYDGGLFWTFGRRERRWEYEDDIAMFEKTCIRFMSDRVKYKYVDILSFTRGRLKSLLTYLLSEKAKNIGITDNEGFLFVQESGSMTVLGVSLSLASYVLSSWGVDMCARADRILRRCPSNHMDYLSSFDGYDMLTQCSVPLHSVLPLSEILSKHGPVE